ncbi:hypothetical protein Salat_2788300 [Sesamum alatum]|uniref:Uncharacterized protein n=1 Tax=Sesamum alatum TaxID=300844 RepID=A0AAE1XKQ4_9LAMI|nr:hypothetical protein Salat_2788300 [Sesamum alatum]
MVWELGNNVNVWADGRSSSATATPMASYHHAMVHEIHVLLVDHESDGLVNTVKLLELCQYRVTFVELASAAISMLLSGKTKIRCCNGKHQLPRSARLQITSTCCRLGAYQLFVS